MSLHPLIDLTRDRQVRQAKGFRLSAAELTGEILEAHYQREVENAPKRHEAEKKYLGVRNARIPNARQAGRDDRHLALALAAWSQGEAGAGVDLPSGGRLDVIDSLVPLRTAAPDKARGDSDPNKGVDDIDLLGQLVDDRLAVVCLKHLSPGATRGGAGDTPLRALLAGLAQAAMVDANRSALRVEVEQATGRAISDEAPALLLAATPRYWEICRKREAQKGAGWIRELERLAREIAEQIGVEVSYLGIGLEGDPGWVYREDGPVLEQAPSLAPAWPAGAGKLKPKPKSKPKKSDSPAEIVEADPSRAPRAYAGTESYQPGDRIEHVQLGTGVVQGVMGPGKISVLFGAEMKLLVHERPSRGV